MISDVAFSNAQDELDEAWQNPDHTSIELDTVDVNGVLEKYYATSEPLHFTKRMLWDMEAKKAWDPSTYIPHVVSRGQIVGQEDSKEGRRIFREIVPATCMDDQRLWPRLGESLPKP